MKEESYSDTEQIKEEYTGKFNVLMNQPVLLQELKKRCNCKFSKKPKSSASGGGFPAFIQQEDADLDVVEEVIITGTSEMDVLLGRLLLNVMLDFGAKSLNIESHIKQAAGKVGNQLL